ncbi:MAG: rod shape-determining protein MreD, partial [Pseudomonadota bacterium]
MGAYITASLPIMFVAVVLQSSFIYQVRVLGGMPDLVLLLTLCWSFDRDLDEGLVWAFVGGILADLQSAAPTGTTTLALIPALIVIYGLNRQLYRINYLLALGVIFGGTVVKELVAA